MEKESCNCFTCRHKNEPRVVAGYLQGYIDASDWFINWAEKNKIKLGSIADDDLGGIYAQMKCNKDESGCLLEEFPDLEKPIENLEVENQRLKIENRKMKSALEKYADDYFYVIKMSLNDFLALDEGKLNGEDFINKMMKNIDFSKLAKKVLKEIDNKE